MECDRIKREAKAEACVEFAARLKLHSYMMSDESQTGIINRYSVVTANQIDNLLKEMLNRNQYCPRCGGALVYNTDAENRLIKWCTACNCNWIVGRDIDTMDKFEDAIKQDRIHNIELKTLEINCDSIILRQNNINIRFDTEKDIEQFDSITINGIKFKKAEKALEAYK